LSDPVTREGIVSEIDPDWLPGTYVDPALSPNGRQRAVTVMQDGVSDIWIKRLPQGRFSRFTLEGGHRATWTADGQALAFWSDRDGSLRVYQRRADGSAPTELVPALELTPSSGHQVVYSEDGEWMIVEADYDIYAVRLDSSEAPEGEPRGIKTTEDREFQPALSPDGRWLAYVSLAPGDRDFTVTVCAFPSCDATYSVSTVTGTTPAWTHDGRQLLYQGPGASLVPSIYSRGRRSIGERSEPSLMWGDFYRSWPHPFDLTRDDQRFVMIRGVEDRSAVAELIVVRNFSEVLEGLFR
jgi:Tol biopolymer transport system component